MRYFNDPKKQRRGVSIPLIVFFVLIIGLFSISVLLASFFKVDNYRPLVSKRIGEVLDRKVTIDKISLGILHGLSIEAKGVSIRDKTDSLSPIYIDKLTLGFELLPLIKKRFVFKKIILHRPQLTVIRTDDRTYIPNIPERFLSSGNKSLFPRISTISIKGGYTKFVDEKVSYPPTVTEFHHINLSLTNASSEGPIPFKLSAMIGRSSSDKANIIATGKLNHFPANLNFADLQFDTDIKVDSVQYKDYANYLREFSFLRKLKGDLKAEFNLKKDSDGVPKLSGKILTSSLPITASHLHDDMPCDASGGVISCDIEFSKDAGRIKNFELNVKDSHGHEIAKIDNDLNRKGQTSIQINTKNLSIEEVKKYIPEKFLPGNLHELLSKVTIGGTIKIAFLTSTGADNQKTSLNTNSYILEFVDVNINQGNELPPITGVSGLIYLTNKEIRFDNLSAKFRNSHLFNTRGRFIQNKPHPQLELFLKGNIDAADIQYLEASAIIPANFSSRLSEIERASGKAIFSLNLKGNTEDFNSFEIAGKIDLEKINFTHKKFASEFKNIYGRIFLTEKYIKFASLNMLWKDSEIKLSEGLIDYRHENPTVQLTLETEKVALENLVSLFPSKQDFGKAVKGFVKSKVYISGGLNTLDSLKVSGDVNFDNTMVISNRLPHPIYLTKGNIVFDNEKANINIENARMGNSVFNIAGELQDFSQPRIEFELLSSYTQLNEIQALLPKGDNHNHDFLSKSIIRGRIRVEKARYNDIYFEDLETYVVCNKGRLKIDDLQIRSNGGYIVMSSLMDLSSMKEPTIQIKPKIFNLDPESILSELNIKQNIVTGSMDISGTLSTQGLTRSDLKKNLEGHVSIQLKNGYFKNSKGMSYISSKLDFDKEFKEISAENGKKNIPYKSISGDFIINKGVITTNNLSINGKKINILASGRIDMNQEIMELKVSILTRNTMERIIDKLPFVGNASVGNDKNLIANFYEVKGSISDPEITKIPSRSLELGMLKAIRKIFKFPGQAFHRPEKVLTINR